MSCKHKFKSNLDGANITTTSTNLNYMTKIFCENCGLVAHDSNDIKHSDRMQARLLEDTK